MKKTDKIIFSGQSNMEGQTEAPMSSTPAESALEYHYLEDALVPLCHPAGEMIGEELLVSSCDENGSPVPDFCRAYSEKTGRLTVAVHDAHGAAAIAERLPDTERFGMSLNVSAIQHFSIGDGDGIRTTVFLKGCNLSCPWCHNPETITHKPVTLNYEDKTVVNGAYMSINVVKNEVLEDKIFYEADGGVTISGGEPMLQADAVRELLTALKDNGISAFIDTAGCVPYSEFEKLSGLVHTYCFDMKACDAKGYRTVGGDFDLVYENLTRLIKDGNHVRVRIPLIPGFNNSPEYSLRMCEILSSAGVTEVDLLPFHRLGDGKYRALGLKYAYAHREGMTRAEAEKALEIYKKHFNARIDG